MWGRRLGSLGVFVRLPELHHQIKTQTLSLSFKRLEGHMHAGMTASGEKLVPSSATMNLLIDLGWRTF